MEPPNSITVNPCHIQNSKSAKRQLSESERALLAKIEAQNKLLEADTKSLKSISSEGGRSTSRRSSEGSISPTSVSVHSMSDVMSGQTIDVNDDQWILWGKIVNDWDEYKRKNGKNLKELVRRGIPHHFRGIAWQLICGAHKSPVKAKYSELLKCESPSAKLIRRDITRTYPDQDFFKDKDGLGQEVLFNVTKAYSLVDKEVGYCQGSAFIAGLLLMQMPEEDAFAVFVTLMKEYRLRELFKPSMAELGLCMFQLDNLLQEHAPELYNHFQAQGFHTSMYASSWFLTLFATTFNLHVASRVMDIFISEGMEIIFRVGLGMLLSNQQQLLQLDMEGMLMVIQKNLTDFYNKDPDLLFQKAYTLVRYNSKKMKKLEKEYMTMKNKEMEEQVEMRKLRTENRLLRQRVEALEKENENLADKLIQDRVNRALEAEEKIIMGKELSIAKRQAKLRQNSAYSPLDNPFAPTESNKLSPPSLEDLQSENFTSGIQQNDCMASVPYSDEFVLKLQQELVQARLREAESTSTLSDLQEKVSELEEHNRQLQDKSRITMLQDELIAVKLREAEATSSLKQLQQKVNNLEENWQKHISRTIVTRKTSLGGSSGKMSKAAFTEMQEELMKSKFQETQLTSQHLELKQKLMELETSNHICTGQLRRADEDRTMLRQKLEETYTRERELQQNLNELNARIAHIDSKSKEAMIALRIREADSTLEIAEMRRKISAYEAKCSKQKDASDPINENDCRSKENGHFNLTDHPDTGAVINQLQEKIIQQQKVISKMTKRLHKSRKLRKSSKENDLSTTDEESDNSDSSNDNDDTQLILDSTLTNPDNVLNKEMKLSSPDTSSATEPNHLNPLYLSEQLSNLSCDSDSS